VFQYELPAAVLVAVIPAISLMLHMHRQRPKPLGVQALQSQRWKWILGGLHM